MRLANNKQAWIIWFIAGLFYLFEFTHRVAPSVMVPELMHDFAVSSLMLGHLSAAYYYAYAIMQIPAGVMLDLWGTRQVLTIAAITIAIGSFIFASTDSITIAILARILIGIGSAFSFIGCLKLASQWFSPQRFGLIVGLTNCLGVSGAILGGRPLAQYVNNFGWRNPLFISGIIGLVFAIGLFLIIRDRNKTTKISKINFSIIKILRNKRIILMAIFAMLMVAPIAAFAELWGVAFLIEKYNLAKPMAAQLASYTFIGIAFGGPMFGLVAEIWNARIKLMMVSVIGALICISMVLYFPSLSINNIGILLFAFGFFTSSMLLCFVINTSLAPENSTGTVVAITNMIIMGGSVLLQPVIGYILDLNLFANNNLQNFQLAFLLLPAAQCLAILVLWTTQKTHRV